MHDMMNWSGLLLASALLFYSTGVVVSVAILVSGRRSRAFLIPLITLAGFVLHLAGIVRRGWEAGGLPFESLRGILFLVAWAAVTLYLLAHFRFRVELLGTVILMVVVALMVVTVLLPGSPPPGPGEEGPAALKWSLAMAARALHVVPVILGVSALFLTFSASIVYLAQDRALKRRQPIRLKLPSLDQCERLAHQSLAWGFSLLTLAVATGVISTIYRSDVDWQWLLREKWSILAWLIFAIVIYDHAFTGGWRGRKAAYLSIFGFGVIILRMVGA